jgi:dephospho-CoA kinase
MLRVGLTGGWVAARAPSRRIPARAGREVIEADELGRALMEPGQLVFDEIVDVFGPEVVTPGWPAGSGKTGGDLAFRGGRLHELNAIVHPAVIAAQGDWMRRFCARSQGDCGGRVGADL